MADQPSFRDRALGGLYIDETTSNTPLKNMPVNEQLSRIEELLEKQLGKSFGQDELQTLDHRLDFGNEQLRGLLVKNENILMEEVEGKLRLQYLPKIALKNIDDLRDYLRRNKHKGVPLEDIRDSYAGIEKDIAVGVTSLPPARA